MAGKLKGRVMTLFRKKLAYGRLPVTILLDRILLLARMRSD
jgi:hypothetical protein